VVPINKRLSKKQKQKWFSKTLSKLCNFLRYKFELAHHYKNFYVSFFDFLISINKLKNKVKRSRGSKIGIKICLEKTNKHLDQVSLVISSKHTTGRVGDTGLAPYLMTYCFQMRHI